MPTNIHPHQNLLKREDKECLLGQKGKVFWLFGLSGSGKSTIAIGLEKHLHKKGIFTQLLDGDNVRNALNHNLGFSDADRHENIRRIAEVAKLHAQIGIVVIASFITPKCTLRRLARQIIGADYVEIFIHCPFEICQNRDVKGLYAKAKSGEIAQFTGLDSAFEEPQFNEPDFILMTAAEAPKQSIEKLYQWVFPRIERPERYA